MEKKTQCKDLRLLNSIRPLYILPEDPLNEEVLIPGFKNASNVNCMVGFFSSEVLASIAPGLATYINTTHNSFKLVISPILRSEDLEAIKGGLKSAEDVAEDILGELLLTEELIKIHTLRCLSWLLCEKRLEIKVALAKDALFHPKVWLFKDSKDVIAVHGSSNVTYAGIHKNIEQIAISKSWQDPSQRYSTEKLCFEFDRLWRNKKDSCIVVGMPAAIQQQLLQTYGSGSPPTENELKDLYKHATDYVKEAHALDIAVIPPRNFKIPDSLQYEDGPYEHQGKAVAAWCNNGYRGVLEMATGSGKTITSMICAHRLYKKMGSLLIVVAAPYVPLIEQWCEEITLFGLKPTNVTIVGGALERSKKLQEIKRHLRTGYSDVEVIVVSQVTLCTWDFVAAIESFNGPRLLIADEVHNLGQLSFINNPPECFEYRLGLSATPVRQYDEEGTEALFDFFGDVVFEYPLDKAIGQCLVEYDYFVHPVYLTDTEMQEWFYLTNKIKQNAWRSSDDKPDEYLSKLLRERRRLLETASGKLSKLESLLNAEDTDNLLYTLIYASDKEPEQLNNVNKLLSSKNIIFHQLTSKETSNRELTKRIIKSFQDGEIQILTAKRVLDEGVNIPQVCKAFILASTTVERQWVQRRGRLLRRCDAIGKTHSVIHDLIVLPQGIEESIDSDARLLVRTELHRVQAFARLARNAGRPDGPLKAIEMMVNAAYL